MNCTICSLLFDSAFDQDLQVLDRAEQVGARIAEPAGGLRQLTQCVAERVAVAVEGVGGLVDERAQRALQPAVLGPQLRASAAVSCSLTSSHSTGTAVRSSPIVSAVGHRPPAPV